MGSERREGCVTSLQRKGERSLVELQSLRQSGAALALCEVAKPGDMRGPAHVDSFNANLCARGNVVVFKRRTDNTYSAVHGAEKSFRFERQAYFLPDTVIVILGHW